MTALETRPPTRTTTHAIKVATWAQHRRCEGSGQPVAAEPKSWTVCPTCRIRFHVRKDGCIPEHVNTKIPRERTEDDDQ